MQPAGKPSPADWLPANGRILVGEAAIRHAIAVAVGRDSVVVGEDQILHQLRTSVDNARGDGGLQPVLERLFALGLRAGRRARSWRVGPGRSLADIAVSAIERQTGPLSGRQVHFYLTKGCDARLRSALALLALVHRSLGVGNRTADIIAGFERAMSTTRANKVPELWDGHAASRIARVVPPV